MLSQMEVPQQRVGQQEAGSLASHCSRMERRVSPKPFFFGTAFTPSCQHIAWTLSGGRERIGAATRIEEVQASQWNGWDKNQTFETSARLFKTSGGKYVAGVEVYNKTEEHYEFRNGVANDSLVEQLRDDPFKGWVDEDILGELFESTEKADQFVEQID